MKRVTTRLVVATTVMVAFGHHGAERPRPVHPGQLLPAFGISLLTWRAIHEWAAVVLTAAVIAHLILHRRRVGQMIAGLARPARTPDNAAAPVVGRPLELRAGKPRRRPPTRRSAVCA